MHIGESFDEVNKKMKKWRSGLLSMKETGYIEYHIDLAEKVLKENEEKYEVLSKSIEKDGWGDGMKVLFAEVKEKATGNILHIKWSDCQNCGAFYLNGGIFL